MLPATMLSIAIRDGAGPASALHPVQVATPTPRAGEILIRVRAAGINRPDLLQRMGNYPPPPGAPDTLGLEVAGEVVVGAGRWRKGNKVCALLGGGGYAEYVAVDARHALPIPPGGRSPSAATAKDDQERPAKAMDGRERPRGLDFVQAAALPETVFTVYANVFEHGALKSGETLLVHGATSGIGVAAIQMAKAAGATVIATARGAAKAAQARALGADVAVDTLHEEFGAAAQAAGGIDVALDMVGTPYFAATLDALRTGGRIVYIASLGGGTLEVPIRQIMMKRAVLTGSTLRPRSADEKARLAAEVERVVWPWIAAGKVRAVVDRTFALSDAAAAHMHLERGNHVGKIVLVV